MSGVFGGATSQIIWGIGACSATGDWTLAQLIKFDAGVTWQSLLGLNGANSFVATGRHGVTNKLSGYGGGGSQYSYSGGADIGSSDGWCCYTTRKLAGANAPVATIHPVGGSATHTAMTANSGALGNPSGAQTSVHFGEINGSDPYKGHAAAFGASPTYLSDANVASLVTTMTRANWVSLLAGVWDYLDDFQADRTGNGASRSSISDYTTDADDPAGWSSWVVSAILSPKQITGPPYAVVRAATI